MRFPGLLNKDSPERFYAYVRNGEASAALSAGEPVCYDMDGTNDGLDVSKATTGAAAKCCTLFAGVLPVAIANGDSGMAQVFGYSSNLTFLHMTRAATTDIWASYVALAIGDKLEVETVGNAFSRKAAGAVSAYMPVAAAGETIASATTLVSSLAAGSGNLALTSAITAMIRAM
ncbi:hypothetical protein LCGC14_1086370 [marine sediment metagenome]|uniref:Uncharacterized protein n=1 Tax=marine sediment metagenome TaxID=412755 RepID=A0A0F9MI03_9ZZZZ